MSDVHWALDHNGHAALMFEDGDTVISVTEHQAVALVDNSLDAVFGEDQCVTTESGMPMFATREQVETMSRAEQLRQRDRIDCEDRGMTPAMVRHLYWDKGMSQSDIGDHFDVSRRTVARRMNEWGIDTRGVLQKAGFDPNAHDGVLDD